MKLLAKLTRRCAAAEKPIRRMKMPSPLQTDTKTDTNSVTPKRPPIPKDEKARRNRANWERNKANIMARRAEREKENAEYQRRYRQENAAQFVLYMMARKAAVRRATPAWFGEFDQFVLEEAASLAQLRAAATGRSWAIDHMVPLRAREACGLHCAANLQVIPEITNKRKGNRMSLTQPGQWIAQC